MKPCTRSDSSAKFLTHLGLGARGMILPSSAELDNRVKYLQHLGNP